MSNQTVLLIEDDLDVLSSLSEVLSACGFDVISAHSSEETIEVLKSEIHPDYIIIDYAVSGLDAESLVSMVKNLYPDSRIIISSGYSEEMIRKESVLDSVDKFMAKPFSPNSLVKEIKRLQ
jgi:DNA-binding NtrC family response regulator